MKFSWMHTLVMHSIILDNECGMFRLKRLCLIILAFLSSGYFNYHFYDVIFVSFFVPWMICMFVMLYFYMFHDFFFLCMLMYAVILHDCKIIIYENIRNVRPLIFYHFYSSSLFYHLIKFNH